MAAVLRVKRRNDEPPLEAFVLACKRRKKDDETLTNENSLTTIVKFAGTVSTQHEDVVPHIKHLKKDDIKESLKKHSADLVNKLRTETKEASAGNRYKVVNYFRHLQDGDEPEEETGKIGDSSVLTVVDIVSAVAENEKSSVNQKMDGEEKDEQSENLSYVYDLYYGVTDDFMVLDHLMDIHPLHQPMDFNVLRSPGEGDSAGEEEDEDDSNDENNWRNDYPDSDHSMNEEDTNLNAEMGNLQIDDEHELSDDEDDERYVYDVEADPEDIQLYGEGYARYKARKIKELYEDPSDEDDYQYGDDSDDDNVGDYDNDEDPELRFM